MSRCRSRFNALQGLFERAGNRITVIAKSNGFVRDYRFVAFFRKGSHKDCLFIVQGCIRKFVALLRCVPYGGSWRKAFPLPG